MPAAEVDVDAVRKLAQTYSDHPFHLTSLHRTYLDRAASDLPTLSDSLISLDPLNPGLIEKDVADHKDYFTKIKFKYLEQESKERYLKYILREDPPSLRQSHNEQLDASNAEIKANLKTAKRALDDDMATVKTLARQLEADHARVRDEAEEASRLGKEVRDMELELARLRAQHPPDQRMTVSKATTILDNQVTTLQTLTSQLLTCSQHLTALKSKVSLSAKHLEQVELERIAAEARLSEARRASEGRDGNVEKLVHWYTNALAGYKELMGIVRMEAYAENELRVTYDTPRGDRTLCLVFDPSTARLGDARVLEEKLGLEDTVEQSVMSNDVPGLVRTVLAVLRCP